MKKAQNSGQRLSQHQAVPTGQQERQIEANSAERKSDDTKEPGETRSKKQKMACLSGRAKTKESAKSVLEQLIAEEDKSIRAPSTHEVVEGIIDSLNQVCRRTVMEDLSKTEAAQPGCSVDITKANSSLPMAKMSATLGYEKWICVRFDQGRCERQEVGPFRPEDPEPKPRRKLRDRISVVIGSITSCYSVRHDTVAERHKAER